MTRRRYIVLAAALVLTTTSLSCQKTVSKDTVQSSQNPKLAADDLPPKEISVTGDCVTVEDPDQNDNGCGALHCAQSVFESQTNPTPKVFTPNDTRHVALALQGCLGNQGVAVIVGHGLAGRIDTGGEKQGPQSTQYIDLSRLSVADWDDCPSKIHPGSLCRLQAKKMSSLTLLGCFTGNQSGQGDTLLTEVIKASGAQKDRAPTGAVFCSTDKKFYFVKGADWQNEPAPIGKQPSVFVPKTNVIRLLSFGPDGRQYHEVELDQVQINLTRDPNKEGPSLIPDKQPLFLNSLNLEEPFTFAGCPIAATKGYVVVNIKPDHDKTIPDKIVLEILGDRLLRDMAQTAPNVFYRSSPRLIEMFNQLVPP